MDMSKYSNIDASRAQDRLREVGEFLERRPDMRENFETALERLNNMGGRVLLFQDFAPLSFEFSFDDGLHGGLIYHGAGDGGAGAPTYSVRVGGTAEGWSIHT